MEAVGEYVVNRTGTFAPQGLANTVWAFGTLGIRRKPLLDAIAQAAVKCSGFTSQGLTNSAWAFATLAERKEMLFDFVAFSAPVSDMPFQELAMTAWSFSTLLIGNGPFVNDIAELATAKLETTNFRLCGLGSKEACPAEMVTALAGALQNLGADTSQYLTAAASSLARVAEPLDAAARTTNHDSSVADLTDEVPTVLATYPGIAFIFKPKGWSVNVNRDTAAGLGDDDAAEDSQESQAAPKLTAWLQSELAPRFPICEDHSVQHGIVHRLDLETSGPMLCATSYQGYLTALLLFASRKVTKEYVCLCKGWLSSQVCFLDAPLLYGEYQNLEIEGEGAHGLRQAKTEVLIVGHFTDPAGAPVSLLQIRLHTGRRHQIRAHLRYEGHPLIGDRTYGDGAEPWCDSLFLHSYHLGLTIGFPPLSPCHVFVPLPANLRMVLSCLKAMNAASHEMQKDWQRQNGFTV